MVNKISNHKMNIQLFASTPVQPTSDNTHISTQFGKLLEP